MEDKGVCCKVFKREVLDRIELKEDRFGFEPEFIKSVFHIMVEHMRKEKRLIGKTVLGLCMQF